ncbi:FAS-associated death domain protein [Aulostomus maculatus]
MGSQHFNFVLLEISNQLSSEQLDSLKFLCQHVIGKRELERTNSGSRLFQLLTERDQLGPENCDFLSGLLGQIKRQDLSEKLKNFAEFSTVSEQPPDEAERGKLQIATDVIAENVGRQWRKLGRKLGLNEVKLESIARKHPTDLEETVQELLKEWRRSRGTEARAKELVDALRACEHNLTADKVEDRLRGYGFSCR